ncbi:hypothetical protein EP7_002413 [Isosphaeraceae bacterium EP7]
MPETISRPARRRPPALAGALGLGRMSRPQLSALILVATALVTAAVLLAWILLWLAASRPRGGIAGWYVAQRSVGGPIVGFQAADLRLVKGLRPATVDRSERTDGDVLAPIAALLDTKGSGPVVVYLSAAGAGVEGKAILLPPDAPGLDATAPSTATRVTAERLIDVFAAHPGRDALLILDAGQVDSDRDLGVYGNTFAARLKQAVARRELPRLAVLCSSGPGQSSWSTEAGGASVFAHFVARGLAGEAQGAWDPDNPRRLTVRGLASYVRANVEAWVETNRRAVQTPTLVVARADLNFPLRATRRPASASPQPVAEAPKEGEEDPRARFASQHAAAWAAHDRLALRRPYRWSPSLWRQYEETLMHIERLDRAGRHDDALALLTTEPEAQRRRLEQGLNGPPVKDPWSLALLRRELLQSSIADGRREFVNGLTRLDDLMKALAGDQRLDMTPAEAELPPAPAGAPAEDFATKAPAEPKAKPREPSKADAPAAKPSPKPAAGKEDAPAKAEVAAEKVAPAPAPTPPPAQDAKPEAGTNDLASAMAGALAADSVGVDRPDYVEGQALLWAGVFARQSGVPDPFRGGRFELLSRLQRLRRLAEEAASADIRIARWIAPYVDEGDALRRRVQDALFAESEPDSERLASRLDLAQARYGQALDEAANPRLGGGRALGAARRCARAVDLLDELQATLPYYGRWRARQASLRGRPLDGDLVTLMAQAAELARALAGPVPAASSNRDGDAPLAALEGKLAEIDRLSGRVKGAFDALKNDFARAVESGLGGGFRELDSLLATPLVPAESRSLLLKRVRSRPIAGVLADEAAVASAAASSTATDVGTYVGESIREKLAARGKREDTGVIAERIGGSGGALPVDPSFWTYALALARVEWGLLEIGGADAQELAEVEARWNAAGASVASDPTPAFEALSELLRGLRRARLEALRKAGSSSLDALAAQDRAARSLPSADSTSLGDRPAQALGQALRQAQAIWHARRLLADFAPEHARRLLRAAEEAATIEPAELAEVRREAEAMLEARLSLAATPGGGIRLDSWAAKPLQVALVAEGRVPRGEAAVLVRFDPSKPLSLAEADGRSARAAVPAAVDPAQAGRIEYTVTRTEAGAVAEIVNLSPRAFYRGRFFGTGTVGATLEPVKEPIAVALRGMIASADQFREHPGQGYMHPTNNLQYKIVLTAEFDMSVRVRTWLAMDGKEVPESSAATDQVLKLTRGKEIPVAGRKFVGAMAGSSGRVESSAFPLEGGFDKAAILHLEITKAPGGETITRRQYPFRVERIQEYLSVSQLYDESTRSLLLNITHLAGDKVVGPVNVTAWFGSYRVESVTNRPLERGQSCHAFVEQIPLNEPEVAWRVDVEDIIAAAKGLVKTPAPEAPAAQGAPKP